VCLSAFAVRDYAGGVISPCPGGLRGQPLDSFYKNSENFMKKYRKND
jgi:hypothetical protein